jgi:hypothetical protein
MNDPDKPPRFATKLAARLVIRVLAFALRHGGDRDQLSHALCLCFSHRTTAELDELWAAAEDRATWKAAHRISR